MLDINLDQIESENITIETQRHLLPTGSEMGQGNNQGSNTVINFTYAGGKPLMSDNRKDQLGDGIRSATGTSSSLKLR